MRSNIDDAAVNGARHFAARYSSAEATLGGDYTVLTTSPIKLMLNPGTADRTVRLPAVSPDGGQEYWVFNTGSSKTLHFVDNNGLSVRDLGPNGKAIFSSLPDGSWISLVETDSSAVTLQFPAIFSPSTAVDLTASRTWTLVAQPKNTVWAGPTSGADAAPTFRAIVAADLTAQTPQSIVNDTNVTGSIVAQVLTLGWTGLLSVLRGGTGLGSYVLGDILYSSAVNTLAALAGNITTTRKFLRQTGNGATSAAPAWDTLVDGDLPNTAVTPGTYGDSSHVGQFTVSANGRITSASNVAFTAPVRGQRSVTASPITVAANDEILNINIAAGTPTCTLPAYATRNGLAVTFVDVGGHFNTNNLVITPNGAETINGVNAAVTLSGKYQRFTLTPANDGTTTGWYVG